MNVKKMSTTEREHSISFTVKLFFSFRPLGSFPKFISSTSLTNFKYVHHLIIISIISYLVSNLNIYTYNIKKQQRVVLTSLPCQVKSRSRILYISLIIHILKRPYRYIHTDWIIKSETLNIPREPNNWFFVFAFWQLEKNRIELCGLVN